MKGVINICTIKERLEYVLGVVGETLIGVSEDYGEALIRISVTDEEWQVMKPKLMK